MKYLQIKLDDKLHKAFKWKCFEQETEMSTVVRNFIKDFIDKYHN